MIRKFGKLAKLSAGCLALAAVTLCGNVGVAQTDSAQDAQKDDDGWVTILDGKSFDGWKINENKDSWKVEDGAVVSNGNRSHLFYVGSDKPFVNFELKAEVMTMPNSNAGIYIHTRYQEEGWPKHGYECQINGTYKPDPIKTGSLYQVVNKEEPGHEDNKWFTYYIKVDGKRIITKINDKVQVDYTEPEGKEAGKDFTRVLTKGTFALQAHDPGSKVLFRKIQVRRLPDSE